MCNSIFDPPFSLNLVNHTYNYQSNPIGEMVSDASNQIAHIYWNVYGKIDSIARIANANKSDLEFHYDALGNRVCKIEKPRVLSNGAYVRSTEDGWKYTYYVYDANGKVMATYNKVVTNRLASNQLGIAFNKLGNSIYGTNPNNSYFTRTKTEKVYELTNHLGNVQATVYDNKLPMTGSTTNTTTAQYYLANMASQTDYYAFGSEMRARTSGAGYRYGMNGQEKDDEVTNSSGSTYTAMFWEYDSRIGRRWNCDPKPTHGLSFYSTFANNPIWHNDPLGDTLKFSNSSSFEFVKAFTKVFTVLAKHNAAQILLNLQKNPQTIIISDARNEGKYKGKLGSYYDPKTKTIYWNPDANLLTKLGVMFSAATILNHEADHSLDHITNPETNKKNSDTPDKSYTNKEEKRVITGSEQKTAESLDEVEKGKATREDHAGNLIPAMDPVEIFAPKKK